jgi:metal-sulfur cluster biosynthetic enzyme
VSELFDSARRALSTVIDPELGLDIVALGLVYDIAETADGLIVEMTLTTPSCPVSGILPQQAADALDRTLPPEAAATAQVRVVWEPPWTPERMDPEVLEAMSRNWRL